MDNIVLVGSSGHAKVIIDIVEKQAVYKIVGLLDAFRKRGEETLGYNILGKEEDLPILIDAYDIKGYIVAIGDNFVRSIVHAKIKTISPAINFVSAVHPSAQLARNVEIGNGTVVMANAVINTDSVVKDGAIINTKASLDHECIMDEFSSLAPNSTVGGKCHIERFTAILLGANITDKINIGEHCVIGAGALVRHNIPSYSVAYGVPANIIRKRKDGDKYL